MDPLSSRHSVEPRSINPLPVIGIVIGDANMKAFGRRGFINHRSTVCSIFSRCSQGGTVEGLECEA